MDTKGTVVTRGRVVLGNAAPNTRPNTRPTPLNIVSGVDSGNAIVMVSLEEVDSDSEDDVRTPPVVAPQDAVREEATETPQGTGTGTGTGGTGATGTGTGTGSTVEEMIAKDKREHTDAMADGFLKQVQFFGQGKGDVIDRLRSCPAYDSRQLDMDPPLVERLRELQADPVKLGMMSTDPRILKAICALQGMDLVVSDADMVKAESDGYAPDLPSITLDHHQRARDECGTREAAKALGNEHFKESRLEDALACYLLAVDLCSASDGDYGEFAPTVYSNIALVYLKMKRYQKAEGACCVGIQVAAEATHLSKLHFRRAQAREQLRRPREAAEDMRRAHEDTQRAVEAEVSRIRQSGSALAKRQPWAQLSVQQLQAETPRILKELTRLEAVAARRTEEQVVRIQEAKVEKEQEVLRVSGQRLPDSRRVDPRRAGESAQLPYAPGVLSEKDWSFWTRDRLAQALQGAQHWLADGGSITILQMDKARADVHATVKIKEGRRALYYDMDISVSWEGVVKPKGLEATADSTTWHRTRGVLRLYNIGQDTQYSPGGDPSTSYMYCLGFTTEQGAWMDIIREEATELFHVAARQIGLVILELQTK